MEKRIELEKRGRQPAEIKELNLDYCKSTSIVGLTDEFTNLETLSLMNVGLISLKDFPKLPNLLRLELSDNKISNDLNFLTSSPKLTYLNLSGNQIKDWEALQPLKEFKNLKNLDLFNNYVTLIDGYSQKVFSLVPSLKYLDGFHVNDIEEDSEIEDDEMDNNEDDEEEDDDEELDEEEVGIQMVYNENVEDDSSDEDDYDEDDYDDDDYNEVEENEDDEMFYDEINAPRNSSQRKSG